MSSISRIYETIVVLHPELDDEGVETQVTNVVSLLEGQGAEIIRSERGGKRRLAYPIKKQRYGYYNLLHFRAEAEVLEELDRMYRLNEQIIRHLTVRFDKEEHLTGLTRMGDDEGRDDDRDDRRRGRRGDYRGGEERRPPRAAEPRPEPATEPADEEPSVSTVSAEASEVTPADTVEQVSEETS
jgi:small subunit ribosomal protein S6